MIRVWKLKSSAARLEFIRRVMPEPRQRTKKISTGYWGNLGESVRNAINVGHDFVVSWHWRAMVRCLARLKEPPTAQLLISRADCTGSVTIRFLFRRDLGTLLLSCLRK